MGSSLTIDNCFGDICPSNICLGDICPPSSNTEIADMIQNKILSLMHVKFGKKLGSTFFFNILGCHYFLVIFMFGAILVFLVLFIFVVVFIFGVNVIF